MEIKITTLTTNGATRYQQAARQAQPWKGEQLNGVIGFDTETALITAGDHGVPPLVIASVYDGNRCHIVRREDVVAFININFPGNIIVGHNIASFDLPVILRAIDEVDDPRSLGGWRQGLSDEHCSRTNARNVIFDAVAKGRIRDSMLLYQLVTLANEGVVPYRGSSLDALAANYLNIDVPKDDAIRLTFGEALSRNGMRPSMLTKAHFHYAALDAIVTLQLHLALETEAAKILPQKDLLPQAVERFGPLTSSIQVKGALALALCCRHGFAIDEELRNRELVRVRGEIEILDNTLTNAGILRPATVKKPASIDQSKLRNVLSEIWRSKSLAPEAAPRTPTGELSLSSDHWSAFFGSDYRVDAWLQRESLIKSELQFLERFPGAEGHPEYTVLVKTGRTSSREGSLQNLPREGAIRNVVIARPGHSLVVVDYRFIELVTLAQACHTRLKTSELARVINDGLDPHRITAASLFSIEESAVTKDQRQKAKAVNFGLPGGMGAASLCAYAKASYKVVLTEDEAKTFINAMQVHYPELRSWRSSLLNEDIQAAANQLNINPSILKERFGSSPGAWGMFMRIAGGEPFKKLTREPYSDEIIDEFWTIVSPNRLPDHLRDSANRRHGSEELRQWLSLRATQTITGRVRGQANYTAYRNTQFQGLAADGAKLALFNLTVAGFKVVGFIHDEIIVEVPDCSDFRPVVERIEQIMIESMREVTPDVAVSVESVVTKRWSKQAKTVVTADGKWLPWGAPSTPTTT